MPIIISIAIFVGSLDSLFLLEKLSSSAEAWQQKCLSMIAPAPMDFVQHSLLCGKNLNDLRWKTALTQTSLIHLFIVSGSHLIVLEHLLLQLRTPFWIRLFFWIFYSLLCGWQPPLVRALASSIARPLEKSLAVIWPRDVSLLASGLLVLVLFPSWVQSRSLLMSWTAGLALCTSFLWRDRPPLIRFAMEALTIYLLMTPLLWGFGNLHPLSALYNMLLAIPVSFWLWPLSALSLLFHFLEPVLRHSSLIFLRALELFSDPIAIEAGPPLPIAWLWGYVFALHAGVHILRVQQRRRKI